MEKKQCLFAKGALGHSLTLDLVAIVHFRLENPADSSLGSLEIGMPAVSILFLGQLQGLKSPFTGRVECEKDWSTPKTAGA